MQLFDPVPVVDEWYEDPGEQVNLRVTYVDHDKGIVKALDEYGNVLRYTMESWNASSMEEIEAPEDDDE